MELKDEDPPPFWVQSTTALHHRRRRHHAASSLFLNTGVLVVFLLATAVVFLAIVIPSVLSLARQVFNPSLVKSSWNSLNLVLVIFAIVCGFLGRKDENEHTPVNSPMRRETDKSVEYMNSFGNVDNITRLRRNSSSYPDIRQEGEWMVSENRWRFYDDTDTRVYNNHLRLNRSRSMGVIDEGEIEAKNIEVDSFVSEAKEAPPRRAPPLKTPSPPPSPPRARRKHIGYRKVEDEFHCDNKNIQMDISESDQIKVLKSESNPPSPPSPISPTRYFWPPSSPPPPPPPPPPPQPHSSALAKNKRNNNQTKMEYRSKVETEMPPSPPWTPPSPSSPTNYFWPPPSPPPPPPPPPPRQTNSLNLLKKKHESNKRNNPSNWESRSKIELLPPPPPPPRSRAKVDQSSFSSEDTRDKKGGIMLRTLARLPRRKQKHTRRSYENLTEINEPPTVSIHRSKSTPEFTPISTPRSPPHPPPSPPSIFQNIFSKKGKRKKKVHSVSTSTPPPPPPPPAKPLHRTKITPPPIRTPVPPPPPPPPFKMPPFKIESNRSYSASEDEDSSPSNQKIIKESNLFCPSPDVNTKADDFIARFRAKLTLEKMNSIKLNQGTRPSLLGPVSGRS